MITPCDLRGGDSHDGAGNMAVTSAGDITSGCIHRDCFLASHQPGHNFDLNILKCLALNFSKPADIVMGKIDILLQLFRHKRLGRFDLIACQQNIAVIVIKLFGICHRLGITTCFDIIEDILNGLLHVR